MKNLSIAFLAAVSLLSFAGCKKKAGGDSLAKMNEFADQMCKCPDKACADKVNADLMKWSQEMGGKEMNADDKMKSEEINKKLQDCMNKFNAPPPPPAPPAGDKPADNMTPPAGDKPADPAAPPAGDKPPGDKPPAGSN
jgi:hypothetical protein